MGVGILCQLFQVWDQVAIGMMTLTEWLLGGDQAELGNEKTLDLVRTQIVRHIINLNLNSLYEMVSWGSFCFENCFLCIMLTPRFISSLNLGQDEEFLFEKGDLNLWAEPLQWARLLHKHLCALSTLSGSSSLCPEELDRFSAIADTNADSARQAMSSLPALPQFSATIEHAKLTLLNERATLTRNVLATIRRKTDSS